MGRIGIIWDVGGRKEGSSSCRGGRVVVVVVGRGAGAVAGAVAGAGAGGGG